MTTNLVAASPSETFPSMKKKDVCTGTRTLYIYGLAAIASCSRILLRVNVPDCLCLWVGSSAILATLRPRRPCEENLEWMDASGSR